MLAVAEISQELNRRYKGVDDGKRRLFLKPGKNGEPFAFHEGESLRGGISRALAIAGVPNSWTFLREFGLAHRNRVTVTEDPNIDLSSLADALGCARSDVVNRAYRDVGGGARDFFDLTVPHGSIETRLRRFSPSFFRAGNQHHLAAWELKFLPFCPVTWDILASTCNICKVNPDQAQGWTRSLTPVDRCDECGRKLANRTADIVPDSMRPALELIRLLVATETATRYGIHGHLPRGLAECNPQTVFDLILGLSKHITTPRDMQHSNEQLVRLHSACRAVSLWPAGLDELTFSASAQGSVLPPLLNAYASLGAEPANPTAKKAYSQPEFGSVSTRNNDLRELVGIRSASAVAGLDADLLTRCWEVGLLTRYYRSHGMKLLAGFDVEELRMFSAAWKKCVSAASVAYAWGLPTYALEQFAALEVLPSSTLKLPDAPPRFLESDVKALKLKIEDVSGKASGRGTRLHSLMEHASGGLKPWGHMFRAILDGVLPMWLEKQSDRDWPKRMFVDESMGQELLGRMITRMHTDELVYSELVTQSDALEILNCSASSIKVLEHLPSQGVNPKLFRLADVVELASKIMPTAEVASCLSLDATRTFRILQSCRVRQIVPGGWDRQHASRLIAAAEAARNNQLSFAL